MCVVSYVSDYYRCPHTEPWTPSPTAPSFPYLVPMPEPAPKPFEWPKAAPADLPWTPDAFDELKKIMAAVKALDAKLGLPDCEDPKKAEWMKQIEDRLAALERLKELCARDRRRAPANGAELAKAGKV